MPLIGLLLIIVPIAELYVIIQVGQEIGVLPTILLLIGVSVLGAYLLKREGMATWKRFQTQMQEGRVPTKEAADGAMILFGGALLLTPGFLTDIVGLLFILPPTRASIKGGFRKLAGGWAIKRMGPAGYVGSKIYETQASKRRAPVASRGNAAAPNNSASDETPFTGKTTSVPRRIEPGDDV